MLFEIVWGRGPKTLGGAPLSHFSGRGGETPDEGDAQAAAASGASCSEEGAISFSGFPRPRVKRMTTDTHIIPARNHTPDEKLPLSLANFPSTLGPKKPPRL